MDEESFDSQKTSIKSTVHFTLRNTINNKERKNQKKTVENEELTMTERRR